MPEHADRDAFLAQVAARLDLPNALARDILDELSGHLDDAAAGLQDAGYDAHDAERRAIRELGDPRKLGAELSRARHTRRQLLAAVGGGVRAAISEGIRTYLAFAIFVALPASLAMSIASAVLHGVGQSTSGYLGAPLGSFVTAATVAAGFAYLGWVVPARVARLAVRSVSGVRPVVAVAGLIAGSGIVWLLVPIAMDPVLAIGLPLGPVAFAITALRAPERPTFHMGIVPGLAMTVVLVVPLTLVALATTTPSTDGGWMADTSVIGEEPSAVGLEGGDIQVGWISFAGDPSGVTVQGAALAELSRWCRSRSGGRASWRGSCGSGPRRC